MPSGRKWYWTVSVGGRCLNVPIFAPLSVTSCFWGTVRISSAAMFFVKKYVMSISGIVLSFAWIASDGTPSDGIASD